MFRKIRTSTRGASKVYVMVGLGRKLNDRLQLCMSVHAGGFLVATCQNSQPIPNSIDNL
jgi:hypothetical protein